MATGEIRVEIWLLLVDFGGNWLYTNYRLLVISGYAELILHNHSNSHLNQNSFVQDIVMPTIHFLNIEILFA